MASSTAQRRARLVGICSAYPEVVVEDVGDSHIAFRVRKKTFAYYLFSHHGDGKIALSCKSSLVEQRRLVREDPEMFFVPSYVGPRGWVGIRLDLPEVDWDIVSELLRHAYQASAPAKLAALVE